MENLFNDVMPMFTSGLHNLSNKKKCRNEDDKTIICSACKKSLTYSHYTNSTISRGSGYCRNCHRLYSQKLGHGRRMHILAIQKLFEYYNIKKCMYTKCQVSDVRILQINELNKNLIHADGYYLSRRVLQSNSKNILNYDVRCPNHNIMYEWDTKCRSYSSEFNTRIRALGKIMGINMPQRFNRRIKSYIYDGIYCSRCGEKDLRLLTIQHKNGGGYKELSLYGARKFYINIYRGLRSTEDLDVYCHNCQWMDIYETRNRKYTQAI